MSPVSRNPAICGGSYVLRGTRMTVRTLASMFFTHRWPIAQIRAEYPHLTQQQVEDGLRWWMRRTLGRRTP